MPHKVDLTRSAGLPAAPEKVVRAAFTTPRTFTVSNAPVRARHKPAVNEISRGGTASAAVSPPPRAAFALPRV